MPKHIIWHNSHHSHPISPQKYIETGWGFDSLLYTCNYNTGIRATVGVILATDTGESLSCPLYSVDTIPVSAKWRISQFCQCLCLFSPSWSLHHCAILPDTVPGPTISRAHSLINVHYCFTLQPEYPQILTQALQSHNPLSREYICLY